MVNPDRWLQSCAEDYTDDEDGRSEEWDDKYYELEKSIAKDGIDNSKHDFADTLYEYQPRLMQAIANGDDVLTLMIIKEVYVKELSGIVNRDL